MTSQTHPSKSRFHLSMRTREALDGYLFMAPAVLGFVLFTLLPMAASFVLGFTEYDLIGLPHWTGLGNYTTMLTDPFFWQALRVTAVYAAFGLPLGLVLALGV